ncbi:hypothetical protein SAMN05444161_7669 [Rhizobiales bacterium GAS191]|jgi:hypothetical protein|nr:hypothetical protein SAMN05519103_06955 [Rhizobiales bacterium GAS113]SED56666.1 hypothetical protein SAMN05519104_3827 [Rhizobiales bacterium GAS188]SEE88970.1 hypothetical protein SAMN05444161_7669 [Rhizobiales bacterium GAS191]
MSHIPTYVYVLFLALLWLGVTRCFPRNIRVARLLVLPALMVVLGIRGFFGLFPTPTLVDLVAALAGGAIGAAFGWHHVRRWVLRVDRAARMITVPGDVMMLAIILGTFAFEFALHYGVQAQAAWFTASPVEPLAAAIWSWFAGMSAGRNLNLAMRYFDAAPVRAAETPLKS